LDPTRRFAPLQHPLSELLHNRVVPIVSYLTGHSRLPAHLRDTERLAKEQFDQHVQRSSSLPRQTPGSSDSHEASFEPPMARGHKVKLAAPRSKSKSRTRSRSRSKSRGRSASAGSQRARSKSGGRSRSRANSVASLTSALATVQVRAADGVSGDVICNNPNLKRPSHAIEETFTEDWADLFGTTGFVNIPTHINPGNSNMFPRLSMTAKLYEKYSFTHLEFRFRSDVGQYAAGGQAGRVMFGIDYDSTDSPPSSRRQLLNTWPNLDCKPSQDMVFTVNCREMRNGPTGPFRFVRVDNLPIADDPRLHDCGRLNIATEGCAVTLLGRIEVRGRVIFDVPVFLDAPSVPSPLHIAHCHGSFTAGSSTTPTVAGYTDVGGNFLGFFPSVTLASGELVLNPNLSGSFMVDVDVTLSCGAYSATNGVTGLIIDLEQNGSPVNQLANINTAQGLLETVTTGVNVLSANLSVSRTYYVIATFGTGLHVKYTPFYTGAGPFYVGTSFNITRVA